MNWRETESMWGQKQLKFNVEVQHLTFADGSEGAITLTYSGGSPGLISNGKLPTHLLQRNINEIGRSKLADSPCGKDFLQKLADREPMW